MSLEGLRAWIGEVERKLGKRTRVFLALAVIAVGLGGAAIYLAIDARESSVSERDVQQLQQELEAQIDEATTGSPPAAEPVEPTEPTPESTPDEDQSKPGQDDNGDGTNGAGTGGLGTDDASGGESAAPSEGADEARIKDLLDQAKAQNVEADANREEK